MIRGKLAPLPFKVLLLEMGQIRGDGTVTPYRWVIGSLWWDLGGGGDEAIHPWRKALEVSGKCVSYFVSALLAAANKRLYSLNLLSSVTMSFCVKFVS